MSAAALLKIGAKPMRARPPPRPPLRGPVRLSVHVTPANRTKPAVRRAAVRDREGEEAGKRTQILTSKGAQFYHLGHKKAPPFELELQDFLDGPFDIVHLRQDGILESRRIADVRVGGPHALDWRVEPGKTLVRDTRGDFRAVAPGKRVLVQDDDAVRLLDRLIH